MGVDPALLADPGLASYGRVVAYRDTSGKAGLRCNHNVLSDHAIVRDMYKVVELCAIPNTSCAEGGPIDAAVGADLHVVSYLDRAHLRKFFVVIADKRKTEPIRADYATGVQNCPCSDPNTVINNHVRMQNGTRADANSVSNGAIVRNLAAFSNFGVIAHNCIGTDKAVIRQMRGRGNLSSSMDKTSTVRRRI